MDAAKIVVHEVKGNRVFVILNFLAESDAEIQAMKELIGELYSKESESTGISREDFIQDWQSRIARNRYKCLSLLESVDPELAAKVSSLVKEGDQTFEAE